MKRRPARVTPKSSPKSSAPPSDVAYVTRLVDIRQRSWFASINRIAEGLARSGETPAQFSELMPAHELKVICKRNNLPSRATRWLHTTALTLFLAYRRAQPRAMADIRKELRDLIPQFQRLSKAIGRLDFEIEWELAEPDHSPGGPASKRRLSVRINPGEGEENVRARKPFVAIQWVHQWVQLPPGKGQPASLAWVVATSSRKLSWAVLTWPGFPSPWPGPLSRLVSGWALSAMPNAGHSGGISSLQHQHTLASSVRTPNREDDPKAVKECDEVAK